MSDHEGRLRLSKRYFINFYSQITKASHKSMNIHISLMGQMDGLCKSEENSYICFRYNILRFWFSGR